MALAVSFTWLAAELICFQTLIVSNNILSFCFISFAMASAKMAIVDAHTNPSTCGLADDRDQTANEGHAVNITAKAINGNTVRTILYNQASSIIDHDGPPKQTKWTIDILTLTASASIYVQ